MIERKKEKGKRQKEKGKRKKSKLQLKSEDWIWKIRFMI